MVCLVLACLLPGFLGVGVFFAYEYKKNSTQLIKDTLQTTRALVQAIDSQLLRAQSIAQSLSTSDSLLRRDFAHFHENARSAIVLTGFVTNITLKDLAGQQILNTAVTYGTPLKIVTNPEQIRDVFKTGRPSYSNVFFDPILKRLVISVDVPVIINNEIVYVLSVGFLPEQLSLLLTNQGLPPDWIAVVLDKSATIAGRTQFPYEFIGKKATPKLVQALQYSREGSIELTTVEGLPVTSVYTRSAVTHWTVAIGIPRAALEGALFASLSMLTMGVAVLFGISMILAWFMSDQIARSVKALIAPAIALGKNVPFSFPRIHVREAAEVAIAIRLAATLLNERAESLQTKEGELLEAHRLAKFGNWYWDLLTGDVKTSETIAEIYGRDVPSFDKQKGTLLTVESWEKVNAAAKEVMRTSEGYDLELEVNHGDGHTIWINSKCQAIRNHKGEVVALRGAAQDITERKLVEQRVRDAALHDVLTSLPNRAFIFEYGSRLLAAARRGHGSGALLFIDLDRFKLINDLYGHEMGDRVLQEVGRRLTDCTRQEDLVGRLGGDEFVIIMPYIGDDHQRAAFIAQTVIDTIRRPYHIDPLDLTLSASIGISYFPANATDMSALIHTADLAMYQAKQTGRANYQSYTPELDHLANNALAIEIRLKNALRHGGLQLYYQPVIDMVSGKLVGAEALLRLTDKNGDVTGPTAFIPIAESTGLIMALGDWVADVACRQQVAWLKQGLKINMAINVSPLQFRQQGFVEKLSLLIVETGIDPAYLEIEVTEGALMDSTESAIDILRRIKLLGVKFALDDFGTGFSSLSSLTSLPLDKIKVDKSFVRGVEHDANSQAVAEAVIALGRSLKLDVHAEGIETEGALDYLKEHGCNQAQGFLFSQALPADEFFLWAQSR